MASFSKLKQDYHHSIEKVMNQLIYQRIKRRRLNRVLEKKRRRSWLRDLFQNRETFGAFSTLFKELHNDRELFFKYIRMSPERFGHLLSLVSANIEKGDTNFRKAVLPKERLVVTLRFLATAESQQSRLSSMHFAWVRVQLVR